MAALHHRWTSRSLLLQLRPPNAPADQEEQQAGQQAEEDCDRSQQERRAVLEAEVEGRATGDPAMVDHLLQGVQDLDPHQIHEQHRQQAQTWRPTYIIFTSSLHQDYYI